MASLVTSTERDVKISFSLNKLIPEVELPIALQRSLKEYHCTKAKSLNFSAAEALIASLLENCCPLTPGQFLYVLNEAHEEFHSSELTDQLIELTAKSFLYFFSNIHAGFNRFVDETAFFQEGWIDFNFKIESFLHMQKNFLRWESALVTIIEKFEQNSQYLMINRHSLINYSASLLINCGINSAENIYGSESSLEQLTQKLTYLTALKMDSQAGFLFISNYIEIQQEKKLLRLPEVLLYVSLLKSVKISFCSTLSSIKSLSTHFICDIAASERLLLFSLEKALQSEQMRFEDFSELLLLLMGEWHSLSFDTRYLWKNWIASMFIVLQHKIYHDMSDLLNPNRKKDSHFKTAVWIEKTLRVKDFLTHVCRYGSNPRTNELAFYYLFSRLQKVLHELDIKEIQFFLTSIAPFLGESKLYFFKKLLLFILFEINELCEKKSETWGQEERQQFYGHVAKLFSIDLTWLAGAATICNIFLQSVIKKREQVDPMTASNVNFCAKYPRLQFCPLKIDALKSLSLMEERIHRVIACFSEIIFIATPKSFFESLETRYIKIKSFLVLTIAPEIFHCESLDKLFQSICVDTGSPLKLHKNIESRVLSLLQRLELPVKLSLKHVTQALSAWNFKPDQVESVFSSLVIKMIEQPERHHSDLYALAQLLLNPKHKYNREAFGKKHQKEFDLLLHAEFVFDECFSACFFNPFACIQEESKIAMSHSSCSVSSPSKMSSKFVNCSLNTIKKLKVSLGLKLVGAPDLLYLNWIKALSQQICHFNLFLNVQNQRHLQNKKITFTRQFFTEKKRLPHLKVVEDLTLTMKQLYALIADEKIKKVAFKYFKYP